MKRILNITYFLVLLFLLSYNLFATDWYVDNTATGSSNGTSWANAWESLASINWASISAGDNIYISGGSSSKTYNETLTPEIQGTAINRVTIIAGKYSPSPSGHSGTPIIVGGVVFNEYNGSTTPKYITIKGFEVTGQIEFNADTPWFVGMIIDSCYIHDYGNNQGIMVLGYVDSLIVQNNIVIDCLSLTCSGETDGMHIANGGVREPRRVIVRNNYMRSMSQDPVAHNDAIQSASCEGLIVYNNIFINDSVNSFQGGGMVILSSNDVAGDDGIPFLFFNNFTYMGGVWYSGANQGHGLSVRLDQNGDTWTEISPTYIFNNTFVTNGPRIRSVGNDGGYAHLVVNNIMAKYCLPDGATNWRTASDHGWMPTLEFGDVFGHTHYMDSMRTNLYWREDSTYASSGGQDALIGGTYYYSTGGSGGIDGADPWGDWVSKGGTGLFRDPKLETPFGDVSDQGTVTPDLLSSSPVIDAGEDLTYLIESLASQFNLPNDIKAAMYLDYYGNERGADGSWDIGAVEYQTSGVDSLPDSFAFTDITNATRSTEYQSNLVTLAGFDSAYARAGGSEYVVYPLGVSPEPPLSWVTGYTKVFPTDQIKVRLTTSANYSTTTSVPLTVGTRSDTYSVTTEADPYVPPTGSSKQLKGSNGKTLKDSTGKVIKTQ